MANTDDDQPSVWSPELFPVEEFAERVMDWYEYEPAGTWLDRRLMRTGSSTILRVIGLLNFLIVQFFFIRLYLSHPKHKTEEVQQLGILYWWKPFSGWSSTRRPNTSMRKLQLWNRPV